MKRALPTKASDPTPKPQPKPQSKLRLDVSYASRRPWVPGPRLLARWAGAALRGRQSSRVLSIRVVGTARSRGLNARYRHTDKSTNVLSFAGSGKAPDGRCFLGELVICAAVVAAEAAAQHKSLKAHWAHMTVHGVLHLQGFDHQRNVEALKMEAVESQILDRLGFSDPYR
jgi:probable rRNA maturation factor